MFNAGTIDYTPVFVAEQFLAQQQNIYAQAQGDIALGLITVYRALGGGWELRLADKAGACGVTPVPPSAPTEVLPPPRAVFLTPLGEPASRGKGPRTEEHSPPADPALPEFAIPTGLRGITEEGSR
jgi:hypothetical protein